MPFSKGPKQPYYIDDATVIYPWFSGKETPMNRKGDKNFGLILNPEQAEELKALNYQVKVRKAAPATDEYEERPEEFFIKCKVNFNSPRPPRIMLVSCIDDVCTRTPLNDDTIVLLDTADIEKVDCKIRPYDREASDTRTAYVVSAFVHVNLDKYDQKYADMPIVGQGPQSMADVTGEPSEMDD